MGPSKEYGGVIWSCFDPPVRRFGAAASDEHTLPNHHLATISRLSLSEKDRPELSWTPLDH
jgi:hypothetical protein